MGGTGPELGDVNHSQCMVCDNRETEAKQDAEAVGAPDGVGGCNSASCPCVGDAELTRLVAAWPTLPAAIRARVLALVDATGTARDA